MTEKAEPCETFRAVDVQFGVGIIGGVPYFDEVAFRAALARSQADRQRLVSVVTSVNHRNRSVTFAADAGAFKH